MGWRVRITEEARKDYKGLDGAIRKQVLAGTYEVSQAPLSGPYGYGKPLGNKGGDNLTGFFRIKYQGVGIRVVYILSIDEMVMNIVVISGRDDSYCYSLVPALHRKYGKELFMDIFEGFNSGEQSGEQ